MATKRSMGGKKRPDGTTVKEKEETFVCLHCGKEKKRSEFYKSRDPAVSVGIAMPCKDCAEKIARNYNPKTGEYGDVSPASLQRACEYVDVPFVQKIWDSSVEQVRDESYERNKTNVWRGYITQINSLPQYRGMRWRDGDVFKTDGESVINESESERDPEVIEECEKNKKEIIRLIGYDPFDKESEEDKPLLYGQLIGYIDMNGDNEDPTRISDSIEMVRGYLQLQKLNDMSAKAFSNLSKTGQSGEIKSYMDTKKKVADVITQLAEQSCISLKHTKNATKGENTFTGKIKKLKELNLREAELNAFDIEMCEGMKQVADISNASIIKQLRLDENDYTEMLAKQREMLTKLQDKSDKNEETARLLLRENLDLKKYLKENNIDISTMLSKETILY